MWLGQFDWVYNEMKYGIFTFTIHSDVSGRPHVLMMLERVIKHMLGHPGVKFMTLNDIADDFIKRFPRQSH